MQSLGHRALVLSQSPSLKSSLEQSVHQCEEPGINNRHHVLGGNWVLRDLGMFQKEKERWYEVEVGTGAGTQKKDTGH
jgi:hypothetical protein